MVKKNMAETTFLCKADDPALPRTHVKLGETHKIIFHVGVMAHCVHKHRTCTHTCNNKYVTL